MLTRVTNGHQFAFSTWYKKIETYTFIDLFFFYTVVLNLKQVNVCQKLY